MALSLDGWAISPAQILATIRRIAGGANIAPRVTVWTEQRITVSSKLTGSPTTSGGHTTLPIETGLSGLVPGERTIVGQIGGAFDWGWLQSYDPATGHAIVKPPITGTYTTGAFVGQSLLGLVPVNGYDFPPPGECENPHYSNDITRLCNSIRVTIDTSQSVMRSLDMNVIAGESGFKMDPERYVFKVYCDIWDSKPFSKGAEVMCDVPIFTGYTVQTTANFAAENTEWQVTAHDPTCKAAQVGFLNSFACQQGASIAGLVVDLLTMDDLPADKALGALGGTGATPSGLFDAGPNYRLNQVRIPSSTGVMPYTRIFSIENASKLQAVDAMLRTYNCYPLFADAKGNAKSEGILYYSNALPVQAWAYETDTSSILVDPQMMAYTSIDQRPNCVIVISEPNGSTGIKSVAYNMNPDSANSIPRLNRIITKTVRDDYIPDQKTADLRAKIEVQLAAMQDAPITITTLPNPFVFDPYDALLVNYANQWGPCITSSPNALYIVTGATMDFSDPRAFRQTYTARKVVLV